MASEEYSAALVVERIMRELGGLREEVLREEVVKWRDRAGKAEAELERRAEDPKPAPKANAVAWVRSVYQDGKGRWNVEDVNIPGIICHGLTEAQAIAQAEVVISLLAGR